MIKKGKKRNSAKRKKRRGRIRAHAMGRGDVQLDLNNWRIGGGENSTGGANWNRLQTLTSVGGKINRIKMLATIDRIVA